MALSTHERDGMKIKAQKEIRFVAVWTCRCGVRNVSNIVDADKTHSGVCIFCKHVSDLEIIEPKPMPYVGSLSNVT